MPKFTSLVFATLLLSSFVVVEARNFHYSHPNSPHSPKSNFAKDALQPKDSAKKKPMKQKTWPDGKLITGRKGAVATEHKTCSDIGLSMLKQGGSAVDAAISAALCVGSIDSFASGIGGGGFMLVSDKHGKADFFNFRETAPAASHQDMFKGHPEKSLTGPLSIAIPGELRGFELAHKSHGKLPWKKVVEPIVKLNRDGFKVTALLAKYIKSSGDDIKKDPALSAVFVRNGELLKEGDVCKRPAYAKTLEIIAKKGVDAFYKGELTAKMVAEIRQLGGIITEEDFHSYKAERSRPLVTNFNGRQIITTPPPTSGAILISFLNILEKMNLKKVNGDFDVRSYHSIVEAFRFAYAQRSKLGDPSMVDLSKILPKILSKSNAAAMRANISDSQTFPPSYYHPDFDTVHSAGTTSLSVIAPNGDAVSLMSTINYYFGSKVGSVSTGVIWNDEMDDFSTPGSSNVFGFPASPNNYVQPGKRPLSSGVPTLVVKDGRIEMSIGASGGSRIISSVAQVLLRSLTIDQRLDDAVNAPRIHNQLFPDTLILEADFDKKISAALATKKHNITLLKPDETQSTVQAIQVKNGRLWAVSDGRKYGEASAQ